MGSSSPLRSLQFNFVGPYWKINDGSAAQFAGTFYQALLNGSTVGAAAREARTSINAASDPTWLAYSVYAHFGARLTGSDVKHSTV
jgi:hypothetical protein